MFKPVMDKFASIKKYEIVTNVISYKISCHFKMPQFDLHS